MALTQHDPLPAMVVAAFVVGSLETDELVKGQWDVLGPGPGPGGEERAKSLTKTVTRSIKGLLERTLLQLMKDINHHFARHYSLSWDDINDKNEKDNKSDDCDDYENENDDNAKNNDNDNEICAEITTAWLKFSESMKSYETLVTEEKGVVAMGPESQIVALYDGQIHRLLKAVEWLNAGGVGRELEARRGFVGGEKGNEYLAAKLGGGEGGGMKRSVSASGSSDNQRGGKASGGGVIERREPPKVPPAQVQVQASPKKDDNDNNSNNDYNYNYNNINNNNKNNNNNNNNINNNQTPSKSTAALCRRKPSLRRSAQASRACSAQPQSSTYTSPRTPIKRKTRTLTTGATGSLRC